MLSRKEQNDKPIYLPNEWKEKVTKLVSQVYKDQLDTRQKVFDIYGLTYPDEVVLIVSLLSKTDGAEAPVTYIMSADLTDKNKAEDLIDTLIDSVGLFYDFYFQTPDWSEYNAIWQDADMKGMKFYYCVSRENFGLTMAADKLLGDI